MFSSLWCVIKRSFCAEDLERSAELCRSWGKTCCAYESNELGGEKHALGVYQLRAREDAETEKSGCIKAGPYIGKWRSEKRMVAHNELCGKHLIRGFPKLFIIWCVV